MHLSLLKLCSVYLAIGSLSTGLCTVPMTFQNQFALNWFGEWGNAFAAMVTKVAG